MKQAMKQSKLAMLLNVGSISILAVLVFLFAFYLIENKKLESLNDRRYQVTNAVQEFLNEANIMTRAIRAYAATGSAEDLAIFNEGKVEKKRFVAMEHLIETGLTPEEKGYADQIMGVVEALMPFEERAVALAASEQYNAALDLVYGPEYMSNFNKFLELQNDLVTAIDTNATADVNRLTTIHNVLSVLIVISLVAVVVIQFINIKLVNKKIIQPVVKVQQQMEELAKGNLKSEFNMEPDTSEIGMLVYAIIRLKNELNTYVGDISDKLHHMGDGNFDLDVNLDYIGDFAPIKSSIEAIVYSLNETLSQINQASGQVAIGADQVSSGAQALSQGTTEQASSIEELSATISEIADQIQQSSEAAHQADTATLEAKNELEVVNKHMFDMVQAMDEISASSSEISKIIKTIDDIAFQTNILALNAAVEAARAGSAGKGFAVVADEVRNLAGKSAEAAKTTTALIESSLQAVQAGSQTAQSTEDALKTVVEKAGVSARLMSQIAENSENQARSAGQISLGISQISSVVQTNSATSEESAATSEELSGQAQMLKTLINKFRLKEQSGVGYYKSEPSYSTSSATIHQYEPADTSYDSGYSEPSYNSKSVNFAPAYKDSKY